MKKIELLSLAAGVALCFAISAPVSHAQVAVSIGLAPDCPYGYYDYAPYDCAPYGYYGPTWFVNGAFIGVGPWFHGPGNFHGHVNNHFDPQRGYHGPHPARGERPSRPVNHISHFKGNEMRDGRGHAEGGRR